MNPLNHPSREPLRGGYPLSTLFLLIAACAVVLGMVAPLVRGEYRAGADEVAASGVMGGFALMLLGGLVGLFHYRRLVGALWGVLIGFLAGLLFGPLMLIPPSDFPMVMISSIGGSVIILAVATFLRSTTEHPHARRAHHAGRSDAASAEAMRHPLDPVADDLQRPAGAADDDASAPPLASRR